MIDSFYTRLCSTTGGPGVHSLGPDEVRSTRQSSPKTSFHRPAKMSWYVGGRCQTRRQKMYFKFTEKGWYFFLFFYKTSYWFLLYYADDAILI